MRIKHIITTSRNVQYKQVDHQVLKQEGTTVRRRPKERFLLGTYYVGFILRAMGYRSPLFPMICRLGPITLSEASGCHYVLQFLLTSLLTANFCSFYFSGCLWHPSEVTALKEQWIWDAATTKNWVPSGNISLSHLP